MQRSDIIRGIFKDWPSRWQSQEPSSPIGRLGVAVNGAADAIAKLEAKQAEGRKTKHFTEAGIKAREEKLGREALDAIVQYDDAVPKARAKVAELRREALAIGRKKGDLSFEDAQIQSEVRTGLRGLPASQREHALTVAMVEADHVVLDAAMAAPRVFGLVSDSLREQFEEARARAGGEQAEIRIDSAKQIEEAAGLAEKALEYAVDSVYSLTALVRPFNPESPGR
jgi:hypothetical protein